MIQIALPYSLLLLLPQKSVIRDQRSKSLKCGFSEDFTVEDFTVFSSILKITCVTQVSLIKVKCMLFKLYRELSHQEWILCLFLLIQVHHFNLAISTPSL